MKHWLCQKGFSPCSIGGLSFALLLMLVSSASADRVFLMGEDAAGLNGLVLTVTHIERRVSKSGGLGTKGKKEMIELEISLFNSGRLPVQIDPSADFSLEIDNTYSPVGEVGKLYLEKPFTIHPGTPSRGLLLFQVSAEDSKASPKLILRRGGSPMVILCDSKMSEALEKSLSGKIDVDEAVKVAQFLIDSTRYDEAETIVSQYYQKYSDNPVLMLQKATLERVKGNTSGAAEILTKAASQNDLGKDESLNVARKAFEQGQYQVAQKILEPLGDKGALGDKELLLLGRCWYFDNQIERSEKLLKDLQERGISDRILFFTLGNIADKRKDLSGAVQWWEKTLKVDSEHYEAMFNIGVAHYKLNEKEKAIDCWKKVLDMNPDAETRKITEETLKQVDRGSDE